MLRGVALWLLASCAAQEHAELLEMNHLLFTTQMMSRDPSYLLEHSDETCVVVGPGGVVEDRDQVIAGLRAFVGVDSVVISRVAISRVSTPCNPIAEERGLC